MEIFDKQIFGEDAQEWLKLTKEEKTNWILNNTNQKDASLIAEFVNNPSISKDVHCLDCRDKKEKITINNIVAKNPIKKK